MNNAAPPTTLLEQMNLNSTTTTTPDADAVVVTPAVLPPEETTSSVVPVLPTTKLFVKRDYLRTHERVIQQLWKEHHVFESNAPSLSTSNSSSSSSSSQDEKEESSFFVTFPYPYMNGVLHIGHAFSFSKALFRSLYEQLHQKNTLLPFAFHCTGMPIQAVTYDL